jgi:hypothetical protein
MSLHDTTFLYLKSTDEQMKTMDTVRVGYKQLAGMLEHLLPDGPDKTDVLRLLRTAAMWSNVAITRFHDGTPRP